MIKFSGEGQVISSETNKYLIRGEDVVSHRVRVLAEGEIWPCKSNAEQVQEMKQYEGQKLNVSLGFESRKENLSVRLIGYEAQ